MDSINLRKSRKRGNCRTRTVPSERRILTSQNRKSNRKKEARVACPANITKRKSRRVNKGTWSSGWEKTTGKIEPKYATSPTVSKEAVMLTATIDALEGQDVVVLNIPWSYLSANMDYEVHVVFRGTLSDMVVMADPALYRPFVSYETGKPVLYVLLQKSLYGCLKSAQLFYEKLVGDLEVYGFKINSYDPCVVNKMIGGKQLTVCWHVDDQKYHA